MLSILAGVSSNMLKGIRNKVCFTTESHILHLKTEPNSNEIRSKKTFFYVMHVQIGVLSYRSLSSTKKQLIPGIFKDHPSNDPSGRLSL